MLFLKSFQIKQNFCYRILALKNGYYVSPFLGTTELLPMKIIKPNIEYNEIQFRQIEFTGKVNSGNIGWNCFLTLEGLMNFRKLYSFIFNTIAIGSISFSIWECLFENIYATGEYFGFPGITTQKITHVKRLGVF